MTESVESNTPAELESLRQEVLRLRNVDAARERAETRLRFDEALSRCVLDSATVGIAQVDLQGRMVYANSNARRYLELSDSSPLTMDLKDLELRTLHPDGSPHRYEDFVVTRCLQTGQAQGPALIGLRSSTGETFWGVATAAPVVNSQSGQIEGVVSTFVDVTHAHELEVSLRQSEDRYQRLVELSPDAIVIHDRGHLVYVNPAGVRLWGAKTKEDLVGRHFRDFVHPRFRKASTRRMQVVLQGSTAAYMEQIHIRMNGGLIRVQVATTPCFYNGKPCAQSLIRDLGKPERDELRVRKQQAALRRFFDHVPAPAALIAADGRMQYVNRRWERLLGWERGWTIYERFQQWYAEPDTHQECVALLSEASGRWQEFRVRPPGGHMLEISWAAIALPGGRRILIGHDVSKLKQSQQTLENNKRELEERLQGRDAKLNRKNAELVSEVAGRRTLEANLRQKQRFLEGLLADYERQRQLVAYELHDTFLQDVIAAQMFLDTLCESSVVTDPQTREPLERARGSLQHAIAEARGIIAGLRPKIIDEQGLVPALSWLVQQFAERDIKVQFEHTADIPRLSQQAELALFRIAQESLRNVERHSRAKEASLRLSRSGDTLRLEISDTGRGFDPTKVPEGHFGLEGIRQRAKLVGGTADVESLLGHGAKVVVELPLAAAGRG